MKFGVLSCLLLVLYELCELYIICIYVLSLSLSLKEHESEGGRTPLMKAVRAGHLETAQYLISKGNTHTTLYSTVYINTIN